MAQSKKYRKPETKNETRPAGQATDKRVVALAVLVVLLVLSNVATFIFMADRSPAAPAASNVAGPSGPIGPDAPLKDFKVVNAHEHLYKRSHLDNYFEAAEKTGIEKTLFVASSQFTFFGKGGDREKLNDWSSMEVIKVAEEFPGKVIPFCTIHPADPEKLKKIKQYVELGAKGLKLYTGHTNFYENRPLDAPEMLPVYEYCEETGLPICWHVNLIRYGDQFERVMEMFPDLTVIMPHFGVAFYRPKSSTWRLLEKLLDTYPNFYTDTSFGTREILVYGLHAVNDDPQVFRPFFEKYADRILFGTDMVVTGNKEKTPEWIEAVIRACRDVLEKDEYYFFMAAKGARYDVGRSDNPYGRFRGLALSDNVLRKVYETNIKKLFPDA